VKKDPADGTTLASLRDVLTLENEALGHLDLDVDELSERPFVDPSSLEPS
jgi:hypothetical protein